MIGILIGLFFFITVFLLLYAVFPSKKYMSDIYQDMYLAQREQTKILKDLRNVFFAKNRKNSFKKEK
jgi:hypothetical protein